MLFVRYFAGNDNRNWRAPQEYRRVKLKNQSNYRTCDHVTAVCCFPTLPSSDPVNQLATLAALLCASEDSVHCCYSLIWHMAGGLWEYFQRTNQPWERDKEAIVTWPERTNILTSWQKTNQATPRKGKLMQTLTQCGSHVTLPRAVVHWKEWEAVWTTDLTL